MPASIKAITAPGRGFLLIEALIALAVATTFSLIFAYFQWTCIRQEREANDYLQAVTLATACIERAHHSGQGVQDASYADEKFTMSWERKPVNAKLTDDDGGWYDTDLKTHCTWFDVTVSWLSVQQRKTSITIPAGVFINNEANT